MSGEAQSSGHGEPESAYLPREVPHRIARWLSIFLIALFAAVALFVVTVPLPDSISCRFVLAPEEAVAPVVAPAPGTARVLVRVAEDVVAGQPLLRLRLHADLLEGPAELSARLDRLAGEQEGARALDVELEAAYQSRRAEARMALERQSDEVRAGHRRVEALRELVAQADAAAAAGVVSRQQLLERRQEKEEASVELEASRTDEARARGLVMTVEAERRVELARRHVEEATRSGEIAEVQAALSGGSDSSTSETGVIEIRAPHDGTVTSVSVAVEGGVVARGQVLVEMSRAGASLRAELVIPERSVGQITTGLQVRYLFDAYPYTRHGVKRGLIRWVSPSAGGGELRALATLDDPLIQVGAERRPLKAGMGGEARIDVGRRTLLEYVFEPLRKIGENLRPASTES